MNIKSQDSIYLIKDIILNSFKLIQIAELKKNIIELNYIKINIINNNHLDINIILPSMALKSKNIILQKINKSINKYIIKNKYSTSINLTSNVLSVSPQGSLFKENLYNIKNIILVVSGKGGVGKSTVASNLAITLGSLGCKVGLLDADIYGPSIPTIWGIKSNESIVGIKTNKDPIMLPIKKNNIKLMSIGFFATQQDAIIWRGPMVSTALKQMMNTVAWGEIDYLIVDLPPGTGDIHISMIQNFPISASIIVTTAQNIAFSDVIRAKNMLDKFSVPLLGYIENMSYFKCNKCLFKHPIFFTTKGQKLLEKLNLDLLGRIPLFSSITQKMDEGILIKPESTSEASKIFLNIAYKITLNLIKNSLNKSTIKEPKDALPILNK